MRLHRLEIEGFGPFRERQSVDFDAFADDGIFLIAGRTGAGKSSILDAVCFGLYGSVPRYDGGEKRLRSDHCEPDDVSEVVVEFSTTAGRFRVTRSPEYQRPAKRGGGMTKQAAGVVLDEWSGEGWVGRAARAVDAAGMLDEILQLSQGQFLQVILLAQNRFARFLLADSKERQSLLRRLFGTERFDDVLSRLEDRRRASDNALGARLATVAARLEEAEDLASSAGLWVAQRADLPTGGEGSSDDDAPHSTDEAVPAVAIGTGTTTERLDALGHALARAQYRAERAVAERDDAERRSASADAELATRRDEQKAQTERDRARSALKTLDAEEPQIAHLRDELDRARRAEALRSEIMNARRAQQAHTDAVAEAEQAQARWAQLGIDLSDLSPGSLEEWANLRAEERGAWQQAAEREARSAERADARAEAETRVTAAAERIAGEDRERADLPHQRTTLMAARDAARRIADARDDRERDVERAKARRAAAAEAARLTADVEAAESAFVAANDILAAAQTRLSELLRRRMAGMAGELATALVDGQACVVCGSRSHPAPAVHSDPVSADDVSEAQRARDAAATAERTATDTVSARRSEHAAAAARADGRTEEQAAKELAAADAAHHESLTAEEDAAAAQDELAELDRRAEALERAREDSAAALVAAREALAALIEREREDEQRITEARGSFGSVAERLAEAAEHIAVARTLAKATAESERRAAASAQAQEERDARVHESEFDGVAAAEAALRTASERESWDAQISAHAVQRETEKAILLPLEMQTLPEEPIDLQPVIQASESARQTWKDAVEAAGRAAGVAERLAGLIDGATTEHARGAEQAAEHEVLKGLADTIAGRAGNTHRMTLETFVLAAELEEIVEAANRRLRDMSAGRYQLRHSDALAARGAASGLGIVVFDAFTGQTRPAQSLSGGETFLSSLALALGLAEVVTARAGGIRLDTLFIDEGFGSLDADTLDVAMRTLDELRAGGRTVGVISHVEAMQEQIPAQLRVEQTDAGPSRIRQSA